MTLDVAYSYCSKLTNQEKLEIDKRVRKNRSYLRFYLKLAVSFPTRIPYPSGPGLPVRFEDFEKIPEDFKKKEKNIFL